MIRCCLSFLFIVTCFAAHAEEQHGLRARYLANSGVMIEHGETKIVFDPLFRNSFDYYDLVPADTEAALLAGKPPFDGIDAVFISHHHEDHFEPALVLGWLRDKVELRLYGPEQAIAALRQLVDEADDEVLHRLHGVSLTIGVHVPMEIPDEAEARPEQYKGIDLFTRPGETRDIPSLGTSE